MSKSSSLQYVLLDTQSKHIGYSWHFSNAKCTLVLLTQSLSSQCLLHYTHRLACQLMQSPTLQLYFYTSIRNFVNFVMSTSGQSYNLIDFWVHLLGVYVNHWSSHKARRPYWWAQLNVQELKSGRFTPPFETARALSQLYAFQCSQWVPIWNSQIIGRYKEIPAHRRNM